MQFNTVENTGQSIISAYKAWLLSKSFPCIAAKAALARQQVQCLVADHMACPKDDLVILEAIYDFTDHYRQSAKPFHSFALIFRAPAIETEAHFDTMMWQRLQALRNLDDLRYGYDNRVSADPRSPKFSFSLKEEAYFIIGLHPASSRSARQFAYPTLVFNPHAEFERLRGSDRYEQMKSAVRKKDMIRSGSANPMLTNFGEVSEVYQYSGRNYDRQWQCPLKNNNDTNEYNPPA